MLLESISRQMPDKKVTGNNQHIITKIILSLTKMIVFCGEMTSSVHERTAIYIFYLGLSKAL